LQIGQRQEIVERAGKQSGVSQEQSIMFLSGLSTVAGTRPTSRAKPILGLLEKEPQGARRASHSPLAQLSHPGDQEGSPAHCGEPSITGLMGGRTIANPNVETERRGSESEFSRNKGS
jgi:hypothetical protein